ncbi:MAG: hypothetical protein GPJ51_02585 [Candidatus Heimdallarchaeota archaeon]|nr:hypothetical protein [Candidatus Heimdallarchaeota archaeon]
MIKHLLILTTYGQIFYSQEFEKTEEAVDVALTGGLMSAIYSMATETQKERISEFEMVTSRILFQEEENDLLFVISVDKRMDTKDTQELLDLIAKRFYEKYGEVRVDGLVLTDFEADATEIIYKKLWYLDTQKRKFRIRDYLATFFVALTLCWYSLLIFGSPPFKGMTDFDIRTFIWDDLLGSLSNPAALTLNILFLIAVIAIPAIAIYLLFKFTYVKDTFRFAKDYLTRPTRASYSELLPNYFLINILTSFLVYVSFMLFAGGFFSELTVYPLFPGGLVGGLIEEFDFTNFATSDIGDQMLIGIFAWFTWVFIFPLIYSLLLGEKKWWKIYRNAVFISSIAVFILMIGYVFGGVKYLEAIGFNPTSSSFGVEQREIKFQLLARIPLNIFLYGYLLFLGIGVNRVTPSKTRIPSIFAVAVAIVITLILQRLVFFGLYPIVT